MLQHKFRDAPGWRRTPTAAAPQPPSDLLPVGLDSYLASTRTATLGKIAADGFGGAAPGSRPPWVHVRSSSSELLLGLWSLTRLKTTEGDGLSLGEGSNSYPKHTRTSPQYLFFTGRTHTHVQVTACV